MIRFEHKSLEEVKKILEQVQVSNRRYNKAQFEKFFDGCCHVRWLVEYDDMKVVAMCVLVYDMPKDYVFVNEIQAFVSGYGYGKKLLEYVLKCYTKVWLTKDMFAEDSLLHYYRSFGLDEFKTLDRDRRKWLHVFSQGCELDVLKTWLRR